ncbi:MAG TPA: HD domain-containing phosphohydrolase, partial [Acidimicrobiia bacterium]|nr:HD domain-containing phosphohydrolase [Acidimicrobiia bacterium]
IAALSLATDLAVGFPMEHGLRSALVAMRLSDRLDVDHETASQAYFLSLLFYVGCTSPVEVGWEAFGNDHSFHTYAIPYRFGSLAETVKGITRAIAPPTDPAPVRVWRVARHLPELAVKFGGIVAATCEAARMLTDQLGLPAVSQLFGFESERWDGKGLPNRVGGERIPLAVRIGQVARDAVFQDNLGNAEFVADVISRRGGGAFDPAIAQALADDAGEILDLGSATPLWDSTLEVEPKPWLMLEGTEIDQALAAMGDFADMAIPELVGHSRGVSELAHTAAEASFPESWDRVKIRRAGLVHDLGRISVPTRFWDKTDPLTSDDWERVRLHAYHTERILVRSPFLAGLAPLASFHHERLDGSGYHRGVGSPSLDPLARLLAAADAYHAMTEPRPHRPALPPEEAAETLTEEAGKGTLDSEAVAAVLKAAGHRRPLVERPAGLTEREIEVVRLLASGLQTKQIARQLNISAKTADSHIQNAYRKMGVATRAGATLYAMQHGLTTWENSR